jgi:hypothetical protein
VKSAILVTAVAYTLTLDGHGELVLLTVGMYFLYALLFATAESLQTKAKIQELLTGFSTCCAVLVLYITGAFPDYGKMFNWLLAQGAVLV